MEPTYIPKDIADYEERIFLGLTGRQLLWGTIAIGTGVSFYLVTRLVLQIPDDICIYGTVIIAFGLFWMGWRKWQNVRPYSDRIKALWRFIITKQKVYYSNEMEWIKPNVFKKKRKDKKINKQYCREFCKQKRTEKT